MTSLGVPDLAETKPFEPEPANTGVGMCNNCKMVPFLVTERFFYGREFIKQDATKNCGLGVFQAETSLGS